MSSILDKAHVWESNTRSGMRAELNIQAPSETRTPEKPASLTAARHSWGRFLQARANLEAAQAARSRQEVGRRRATRSLVCFQNWSPNIEMTREDMIQVIPQETRVVNKISIRCPRSKTLLLCNKLKCITRDKHIGQHQTAPQNPLLMKFFSFSPLIDCGNMVC